MPKVRRDWDQAGGLRSQCSSEHLSNTHMRSGPAFAVCAGSPFIIGERLEAHKRFFELIVAEAIAQFLELVHERVTPGVLANHKRSLLHADILRDHDLIGLRVL